MKQQHGFTLVEISIVLVIIGLLLGGVMKGQEMIDSARAKSIATDLRQIPLYLYAYQDKYRALPGDDASAASRITGATTSSTPATCGSGSGTCLGNGQLDGTWLPGQNSDETYLLWQHLRLAGFANGSNDTSLAPASFLPRHAEGGVIGVESASARYIKDAGSGASTYLNGSQVICASNIRGKLAKQLDLMLDDGNPQSGAVRVVADNHTRGNAALDTLDDATRYTVCQGV